jgi:hypothetical protein
VAALVYRRRLHVVTAFLWLALGGSELAPSHAALKGYNLLAWSKDGMAYWVGSDPGIYELRQQQVLLG